MSATYPQYPNYPPQQWGGQSYYPNNFPPEYFAPQMQIPSAVPQQEAYQAHLDYLQQSVKHKRSSIGSYAFNDPNIKFAAQNPREKVFVLLRAHPYTNVGWIFRTAINAVAPVIIWAILVYLRFNPFTLPVVTNIIGRDLGYRYLALVLLMYYSFLATNAIRNFVDWYFNLYLVTNERIVDYNFEAFVSYNIAEARIENIEDVRESSVGFLPSLLGYGDIIVQTAAATSKFDFISVPQPSLVRDIIADMASYARKLYGAGAYIRRNQ